MHRGFRIATLIAAALAIFVAEGCTHDCAQSADIQVNVVPSSDLDTAAIAQLRVVLSVNGAEPKTMDITPAHALSRSGSAFILRPNPPPADHYNVTITIQAISSTGALLAIGSESADVLSKGCNRISSTLAAIPISGGGGDGGVATDLAGDLGGLPPDLAGCVGGSPDEDNDGRANFCDLCPADYDPSPMDSDGDGLPNACDPDVNAATNRLVYFEPFDTTTGHWSGNFPVTASYLNIDSPSTTRSSTAGNSVDTVPSNIRAQMMILAPFFYTPGGPVVADSGIFVGTSSDPFSPGTNGVLCSIVRDSANGDALVATPIVNGNGGTSVFAGYQFYTMVTHRIRLTQRGNKYSCEATSSGNPTQTVTLTTAATPTGNQFVAVRATSLQAHFNSVVVETALP